MSPISEATVNALIHPRPGSGDQQRDIAVIGALALELHGQRAICSSRSSISPRLTSMFCAPRVRDLQAIQQLAAGVTEQIT